MPTILEDIRYAFRGIRKNPGVAGVAVLSLGIGIGANTAIFSLMDRMLFRSLPVRDAQQLVLLRAGGGWSGSIETTYGDDVSFSFSKYKALEDQTSAIFEGVLARYPFTASIAAKAQTDAGAGELVSGNYFDLLGVRPALGRLVEPEDARTRGSNPIAVLSYGYWKRRFGGDPGVLNQSILVNGTPLTVVGVAQQGFRSIGAGEAPELFVPVTMAPMLTPPFGTNALENAHAYWLNLFGRLRPGVTIEQASASVAVPWRRILESDADTLPNASRRERYVSKKLDLRPAGNGISSIRSDFAAPLYLLMGMVGMVLLIACVNVANLLLARAVARGREIAIRLSLGASRGRLIRHVLTESVILSLAGGLIGLLVASWSGQLLLSFLPEQIPTAGITTEIDGRLLAFTFLVATVTGLLFGCIPAFRATRVDLTPVLKEGSAVGSGHARFRKLLVVGQIALSALLLASAGLFSHSLQNLHALDPGFRAVGLESFSVNPRLVGYPRDRALRLFDDLQRELSGTPGVTGVSMAKMPLITGSMDQRAVIVEGYQPPPGPSSAASANSVGPDFFSVMGIPLMAGREFRESDNAAAPPVAVINETFARKYFEGRNPLGMHLTLRRGAPLEIVGVVKDAKYDDLREKPKTFVYFASAQDLNPGPATFYIRGSISADTIRSITRRLDASLPIDGPRTVQQQIQVSVFLDRMVAMLAAAFALLATLLAAVGLYGVVAWAVMRRRREIGIRMALGAEPGSVMRMVLGDVLRLGIGGIAIAAPVWFLAARFLKSLLFGVTEYDLLTLALSLAAVMLAAVAAGLGPAWRASRIDPISAIRYE